MAVYDLKFFGWNYDPKENHDKVWGYVKVNDVVYNFWGRRGKKFTFKRFDEFGLYDLRELARKKINGGYKSIDLSMSSGLYINVEKVYTDFDKEFRNQLMIAKLSQTFHGE